MIDSEATIFLLTAVWFVVAALAGLLIGRFLRRCQLLAEMRAEEVCTEDGCDRAATHERFEGITDDGTPIMFLTCHRHAQGGRPR
jgi:hypothetical protein